MFQHTAARGRLRPLGVLARRLVGVSTHSRPWAADPANEKSQIDGIVSTHSRPWAAEATLREVARTHEVSTHSRPWAADCS